MKRIRRRAEIRRRFRTLRAAADLSQMETAEKTGISTSRYWRLENGYDEPTDAELAALARLFKASPSDFAIREAIAS